MTMNLQKKHDALRALLKPGLSKEVSGPVFRLIKQSIRFSNYDNLESAMNACVQVVSESDANIFAELDKLLVKPVGYFQATYPELSELIIRQVALAEMVGHEVAEFMKRNGGELPKGIAARGTSNEQKAISNVAFAAVSLAGRVVAAHSDPELSSEPQVVEALNEEATAKRELKPSLQQSWVEYQASILNRAYKVAVDGDKVHEMICSKILPLAKEMAKVELKMRPLRNKVLESETEIPSFTHHTLTDVRPSAVSRRKRP